MHTLNKNWFFIAYIFLITVLYFLILKVFGIDILEAQNRGYLYHIQNLGTLIPHLGYLDFTAIRWDLIASHKLGILLIFIVSICDIFFHFSCFELSTNKDLEADYELKFLGISNIFIGLCGGLPSYTILTMSILTYEAGASIRLMGFFCLLSLGIILLFGATLLNFIPKIIIAIILMYLGLSFIKAWLIDTKAEMNILDYALLIVVFGTIALVSFNSGILVGIIISAFIFLIRYCNLSIFFRKATGDILKSTVVYSKTEKDILSKRSKSIYIAQLQNYLFFGNIMQLSDLLKDVYLSKQTDFIIVDFKKVTGKDISVYNRLIRIIQSAETHGVEIIFSSISNDMLQIIKKLAKKYNYLTEIKALDSLEYALEYCEEKLIQKRCSV